MLQIFINPLVSSNSSYKTPTVLLIVKSSKNLVGDRVKRNIYVEGNIFIAVWEIGIS